MIRHVDTRFSQSWRNNCALRRVGFATSSTSPSATRRHSTGYVAAGYRWYSQKSRISSSLPPSCVASAEAWPVLRGSA
eukprot:5491542-Pleurochrysis_carterae.AAC.2